LIGTDPLFEISGSRTHGMSRRYPPCQNKKLDSRVKQADSIMVLTVPIADPVAAELTALARSQGKTAEQVVAELVERFLEDAEDLADALDALQDGEALIPLARVKTELGF